MLCVFQGLFPLCVSGSVRVVCFTVCSRCMYFRVFSRFVCFGVCSRCVFQGLFALGRMVAVPVASRCSAAFMLLVNIVSVVKHSVAFSVLMFVGIVSILTLNSVALSVFPACQYSECLHTLKSVALFLCQYSEQRHTEQCGSLCSLCQYSKCHHTQHYSSFCSLWLLTR